MRVIASTSAFVSMLILAFALAQGGDGMPGEAGAETVLRTASFGIFPVEGSAVSGQLNVIERVEGGTRLVVTLQGISEGNHYLPVLFRGDCGPDRERLGALVPVGTMTNDPYVSINDEEYSYDELSRGDYFIYVFAGDTEDGQPLACGEVGAGANR